MPEAAPSSTAEAALAAYDRGNMLQRLRRLADALASYDQAIALRADFADAYNNRGVVLHALAQYADALASYDEAIALRPGNADTHYNRGLALFALGRLQDAVASYDAAVALKPDLARAYNNRGTTLARLGRHEDALASFDRAISVRNDYAEAYNNRGSAFRALGRHGRALASFDRAIALAPDFAEAHHNRGVVLQQLHRPAEALSSHDRAIALKPDFADAHDNRGVALAALERYAEALASHDRALALNGGAAGILFNRGIALDGLGRFTEALVSYDRSLALQPENAQLHNNRGTVLQALDCREEALASFETAMALDPTDANSNWNVALCLLGLGQYQRGWVQHEWRKKLARGTGHRPYPQPEWLGGQDVLDKTLFIHWEQGFGDTLQFCRYVTALPESTRIVLEVQRPLVRLMQSLRPGLTVIAADEPPPPFDLHCPMMSLPLAFRVKVETIPARVPYLHADPTATAAWRTRLAALPGRRVGLCWAGDPHSHLPRGKAMDRRRSIELARLGKLGAEAGLQFVSLQKGPQAVQAATPPPGMTLHDWSEELTDFADTAALIEALDLVITVDTAVAHLAGALGKPVWVLNRFDACWRWLTDRTDSPWYPTARLFRQPASGDWDSVMAQVADALRIFVA